MVPTHVQSDGPSLPYMEQVSYGPPMTVNEEIESEYQ